MRHTTLLHAIFVFVLAVGVQSAAASTLGLEHFERLSFDVRGHRLRADEQKMVRSAVDAGERDADRLYASLVREWLDKDALKRYVDTFLRFVALGTVDASAETFFHRLARHGEGERAVYYLPHTVEAGAQGLPCPGKAVTTVETWWQENPIAICQESYRPEVLFDEVGYCSGEAEPLMRQPPRPGCGCGPMLMGCLPPEGENPALEVLVRHSVEDEWYETAARIVDEDRSLDELLTTSRTWQTGLTEFLYLRRELLGELHAEPWSPERQAEIQSRVADVDVFAPGRWVERSGLYEGSGIWWTSLAPHALKVPVRGVSHHLLARHLGSDFHAVNVDAKAVLEAVGRDEENLRTLSSITAAPMRYTKGCKGCHAPMDGVAGFLGELQGPMYGSFPTGETAEGEFFVSGAEDFRGKGSGAAELSRYVTRQPEFETVAVRRAFEEVMLRPLVSHDHDLFEDLVAEFRNNGHRWRPILQRLFESAAYRNPGASVSGTGRPEPTAVAGTVIPEVVKTSCISCHDQYHDVLDLRELPEGSDVAAWKRIWARVTDYSMPPPAFDGEITGRFPLDPSVRKGFVASIERVLGPALDRPASPRRLDTRAWLSVVRDVAEPVLPRETIEALTRSLRERVVLRKQPPRGYRPPLQLVMERISEDVCREVASAESDYYGLSRELDGSSTARARPLVTLLARVYGRAPAADEVEEAEALLGRFLELTGDPTESWVGLCSTYLSSPRLLFELYAAGETS